MLFLGKVSTNKDDVAEYRDVFMIRIKTGWFSSVEVSHDALVCINDIGLSVKTKTKLKYFYKPYFTRQKTRKFRFRVDIEDNIVVGWRDLD